MIQYMLQAAIAMALLILPYILFFRKETFFRFNRVYLISALVVAILAPFAPKWISISDPSIAFVLLNPIEVFPLAEVIVSAENAAQTLNIWDFLGMAYWIVAMILIGKLIIEISAIARIYQIGDKEVYNDETIIVHDSVEAPFSFFNAVYLSPEIRNDYARFSKIFKHEVTHIKYRHSIDAVLVELLCAVFWINPLVYVYKRALKAVHEYQADDVVDDIDLIEYTQLLLSQSQSGLRLVLTNQFFQSQLKARIVMMMKQRSNEVNKWKYLVALPVLALSILLFSFKNSDVFTANSNTSFEQSIILKDTLPKSKDGVYMQADEMPQFPGCEEVVDAEKRALCAQKKLLQYVYENIKYPSAARKNNIQGTVVVEFNVSQEGIVEGVTLVRGVGGGCDEESMRVVNTLNDVGSKWTPGQMDNKPVAVKMTLPIKFKLSDDAAGSAKVKVADGDVYQAVDVMPLFPGCDNGDCSQKKMLEYIFSNIKFPEEARAKKVDGKVVVTFIVEPNGLVSSVKLVKSLDTACDAEVIRVIESFNSMPDRWTPGIQNGEKVRVEYAVPVMFRLD